MNERQEIMADKRRGERKENEEAIQSLFQLGNKPLQPQQQPQLWKLAQCIHYYLKQIYTARLAHSGRRRVVKEQGKRGEADTWTEKEVNNNPNSTIIWS